MYDTSAEGIEPSAVWTDDGANADAGLLPVAASPPVSTGIQSRAKTSTWTMNQAGHLLTCMRYLQSIPGRLSLSNPTRRVRDFFEDDSIFPRGHVPLSSSSSTETPSGGACKCRSSPDSLEPKGQLPAYDGHGQTGPCNVPFLHSAGKHGDRCKTQVDGPMCTTTVSGPEADEKNDHLISLVKRRPQVLLAYKRRTVSRNSAWPPTWTGLLSEGPAAALWLVSLSLFVMILLYTLLGMAGLLAGSTRGHVSKRAPVVTLRNGSYVGVHSPQYRQDFFLGMPYAQKPVRFENSQHLNSTWKGRRKATKYPLNCVGYVDPRNIYESSEDCLYLNVIRPAGIHHLAELPVAVWIHGGALVLGGSADPRYNLSFIVERSVQLGKPIIGVSLNYRLSVFGFPWGKEVVDAGVGNLGFKDQRLALAWINENIGAFGGSKDKVTIWGESSGAESASIQTYAYNGRDDKLFRAAVGESGFAGPLMRLRAGLNDTASEQRNYNSLVTNTSCASTVNTPESLECLRALPLAELNDYLNKTAITVLWGPVMDGDFISEWPSVQLREGKFPKIPLLLGCNTDEGTSFLSGRRFNTDDDLRAAVALLLPEDTVTTTGKTVDELVDELMDLYPDDQAVGIPGLYRFPPITEGSSLAELVGLQYRRAAAIFGDYYMQYARRRTAIAWSKHDVPTWSYRFDVLVNGMPAFIGATHFDEVAFVFYNLRGVGYNPNPFANASTAYIDVAKKMSAAWINFFNDLDPNGPGAALALPAGETWVPYDAKPGHVGENIVFAVNNSRLEKDDFRRGGLAWMADHSLSLFGN